MQVKLRGFRIELEEVEAVLRCSPVVRACAVTVAGTPPRLVAWLRLEPSAVEVGLEAQNSRFVVLPKLIRPGRIKEYKLTK